MPHQTPLYLEHVKLAAKLVDFAGWEMPQDYGSQIQEHHAVRQDVGMFDVSHMGVLDIEGKEAKQFLRYLLANDVAKLKVPGKALYSCMLNHEGGVIDDLIVYYLAENFYRIVLNAGRREVDLNWFTQHAKQFAVTLQFHQDKAIIAVQGPATIARVTNALKLTGLESLQPFHTLTIGAIQVAATGYTGELGVELIVPDNKAVEYWQALSAIGVKPCGLGARDTLRLEAGYNLYGLDMTEATSPLTSNLSWTLSFTDKDRDFIGRKSLEAAQAQGVKQNIVGLVMEEKGVLRNHQLVYDNGTVVGEITSGSFSPTLGQAIALARINRDAPNNLSIDRRGKMVAVKKVKPYFVKLGQNIVEAY